LPDDADLRMFGEHPRQARTRRRLIVHDQAGHGAQTPGSWRGIRIVTRLPGDAASWTLRLARPSYKVRSPSATILEPRPWPRGRPAGAAVWLPTPLSSTASRTNSPCDVALMLICPWPTLGANPCLMAFSTTGWRISEGIGASETEGSISRLTRRRAP